MMFKNFGQLLESYSVNAEGTLFPTRSEMENACISFLKKNVPFAKNVYIPNDGFGATENDFINGVCNLKIQMKSSSNYLWNHNIKSKGLLDINHRLEKAKLKATDGDKMHIRVFNGNEKLHMSPGLIVLVAAGNQYVLGNINNPSITKEGFDKMYKVIQAAEDDREFLAMAGQEFGQIYDKDLSRHSKEFSKLLSK